MKAWWVLAASGWLVAACGDKAAVAPTWVAAASSAVAPATPAAPTAPAAAAAPATVSASADRLPPPVVPPVDRGGVLVASDTRSGQRLWTLAVYDNPIDLKLEADVQWLFFKSMAFDTDGRLRIVNEAGRTYFVDVNNRRVSALR